MTKLVGEVQNDIQENSDAQIGIMPEKLQEFHFMNGKENAMIGRDDIRRTLFTGEHPHLSHDPDGFDTGKLFSILESDLQHPLKKDKYFERFLSGAKDEIAPQEITTCADMEYFFELADGQPPKQRNLPQYFYELGMMMKRESPFNIYPQIFIRRIVQFSPIHAGSPCIIHFPTLPGSNGFHRADLPEPHGGILYNSIHSRKLIIGLSNTRAEIQ